MDPQSLEESLPLRKEIPDPNIKTKSFDEEAEDKFISSSSACLQLVPSIDKGKFDMSTDKCNLVITEPSYLLRSSENPAKLVIDLIQESFPDDVKKTCKDFEDKFWTSYLSHLKQLMSLSHPIDSDVKEIAKNVADRWKGNLINVGFSSSLEIFCFLHLLSAYDLIDFDNGVDISSLIKTISQLKNASKLCRDLDFVAKMTELIHKLVEEQLHVNAICLVYTFGLEDEVKPAQLLKKYLDIIKSYIRENSKKRRKSSETQAEASEREISALRAAIDCIRRYRLESEITISHIEECIIQVKEGKNNSSIVTTQNLNNQGDEIPLNLASQIQKKQQNVNTNFGMPVRLPPQHVGPVQMRPPTLHWPRPIQNPTMQFGLPNYYPRGHSQRGEMHPNFVQRGSERQQSVNMRSWTPVPNARFHPSVPQPLAQPPWHEPRPMRNLNQQFGFPNFYPRGINEVGGTHPNMGPKVGEQQQIVNMHSNMHVPNAGLPPPSGQELGRPNMHPNMPLPYNRLPPPGGQQFGRPMFHGPHPMGQSQQQSGIPCVNPRGTVIRPPRTDNN